MVPCWIAAGYYEVCAYVTLISEEMLFEHGHDGGDAGFAAGREGVEFEVRGDEGGGEFGVGGCAGAGAPDLGGRCSGVFRSSVIDGRISSGCVLLVDQRCVWSTRSVFFRMEYLTLSATIGPLVARVSAAMTTPPS